MLFTFVLGLAAGALTPVAEPHLHRAIESLALTKIEVEKSEMDLVALVLLLLLAAVLSGGGSSFALLLGALVGVFGKRILDAIQGKGDQP